MKLPKPTDDNNAIKVDIYDKKDMINQILSNSRLRPRPRV